MSVDKQNESFYLLSKDNEPNSSSFKEVKVSGENGGLM